MATSSNPDTWPPLPVEKLVPSVLLASFHICTPPYFPPVRIPGLNTYLILDGQMRFEMSDGARGIAGPDTLVTFYAGLNRYEVVSRVPLAIYQIVYYPAPPPYAQHVPSLDGVERLPHVLRTGDRTDACAAIFERIMRTLLRLPPTWHMDNAAAALELLSLCFQCVERRQPEASSPVDKWQRLLIRLEEEQYRFTDVGQLAADMGLSVDHFIRKFRQYTGRTPKQYLLQRHLWNARQLLAQGASVKAAALQTGFNDQCYFSRIYKAHFGHAPTHASPGADSHTRPPPLMRGTTPTCRHLLAPGVPYTLFSP